MNADFASEATKGIHQAGKVADVFFSQANIDALQHGMRFKVFQESGGQHVIDRQSDDELKIIMRGVYLDNSDFREFAVLDEVRKLNALVLDYAVPRILREVESYMRYVADSGSMPTYMPHAASASVKGTRSLEMNRFV